MATLTTSFAQRYEPDPPWIRSSKDPDFESFAFRASDQLLYTVLEACEIHQPGSPYASLQDARARAGRGRSWPITTSLTLAEMTLYQRATVDNLRPMIGQLVRILQLGAREGAHSLILA